jgi:hypothetical protein
MISIKIDTSGALLNGQAPQIVQKNLDKAIVEATLFLWREVQSRTPQGVSGYQGGLISTIQHVVTGKGTPAIKGVIAPGKPYGDVIEKGRTAGKGMPPEGSLLRWLEVKLGLSEKEAKRIEFVVRRKIKAKGFEGAHMFEQAFKDNLSRVEAIFTRAGFTMAEELNA